MMAQPKDSIEEELFSSGMEKRIKFRFTKSRFKELTRSGKGKWFASVQGENREFSGLKGNREYLPCSSIFILHFQIDLVTVVLVQIIEIVRSSVNSVARVVLWGDGNGAPFILPLSIVLDLTNAQRVGQNGRL